MDYAIIIGAAAVVLASAGMLLYQLIQINRVRARYAPGPDDTGDDTPVERPDDTGESSR